MTPLRRHRPSLIWVPPPVERSHQITSDRLAIVWVWSLPPAPTSGGFAEASKRGRTTILAPGRSVTHSTTLTVGHAPRTETSE